MPAITSVQQRGAAAPISPSRPVVGREREAPREASGFRRLCVVAGLAFLVWAGWKVTYGNYYTPRSAFGYYLGVTGSLMMLLPLLGYPLRKHTRFMRRWGAMKHWLRLHIFLGFFGPALVLFHSTFHVRSLNAAVAIASMLLVVASGMLGRYFYAKIHFGLYGRRATLQTLKDKFSGISQYAKPRLHFAPAVEERLRGFEHGSIHTERSFPFNVFWFFTLGMRRKLLEFRCARELRRIFRRERVPEFPGGAPQALRLVVAYLKAVQRVSQFGAYERIFSLWHVLHVPLLYILVGSAIFHVIAVYMY